MIRTQIQLHPEEVKWLKKFGHENGISMSQAIRDSVNFYRAHLEKSSTLKLKKKNALKAVGVFASHDEK